MKLYTTNQAAAVLGLSVRRVQQAAASMGVEKRGRDYILTEADLRRIAARIGQRGRPGELPGKPG